MKRHVFLKLNSLFVFFTLLLPSTAAALKIDDTHYRFCVMDDATIKDSKAVQDKNSGRLRSNGAYWTGFNMKTSGAEYPTPNQFWFDCSGYITELNVLMANPINSDNGWTLHHNWEINGSNGYVNYRDSYFYITIDAPEGVSLTDTPSTVLIGDERNIGVSLEGSYTSFSGNGYFDYSYSSSNPDIISVTSGKISAKKGGKAKITVEVYAKNHSYSGSYYIGSASKSIEVVNNLTPKAISVEPRSLDLTLGQEASVTAILTPKEAETEITWSSSNDNVASVENGRVKATGKGKANITAKTSNGLTALCSVTVSADQGKELNEWCISGNFNGWSETKMNSIGEGLFMAEVEYLTPEFKFKPVDSWDNNLGAPDGKNLLIGKSFALTEYGDPIKFYESVTAIVDARITLNVPDKTVTIQGTAVTSGSKVSMTDVNCTWGMAREQVISSQEGGYYICQENETIVVFSKMNENMDEIYLAYKFNSDGKLCASTLSMPENSDSKHISDEFFAQYDSEITLEDGLEVKTDDSNLIAVDISSTINGGGNIITLGFSYYEPLEERDDCVDLGLSVRWATMNLGASKPSGVGGFYAFSETSTKSEYWRENYAYCNNNSNQYIFDYTNPQTNRLYFI